MYLSSSYSSLLSYYYQIESAFYKVCNKWLLLSVIDFWPLHRRCHLLFFGPGNLNIPKNVLDFDYLQSKRIFERWCVLSATQEKWSSHLNCTRKIQIQHFYVYFSLAELGDNLFTLKIIIILRSNTKIKIYLC